jgi:hypothetical protein
MHRIEVLGEIEEHEEACLHKSTSGRWFWTSQHRIRIGLLAKLLLALGVMMTKIDGYSMQTPTIKCRRRTWCKPTL